MKPLKITVLSFMHSCILILAILLDFLHSNIRQETRNNNVPSLKPEELLPSTLVVFFDLIMLNSAPGKYEAYNKQVETTWYTQKSPRNRPFMSTRGKEKRNAAVICRTVTFVTVVICFMLCFLKIKLC